MQDHALDARVFIRSLATRGHLGGLSLAVPDAIGVLGRRLRARAHRDRRRRPGRARGGGDGGRDVVVLTPGWGDAMQAAKAGLLEIADLFVMNKADRPGRRGPAGPLPDAGHRHGATRRLAPADRRDGRDRGRRHGRAVRRHRRLSRTTRRRSGRRRREEAAPLLRVWSPPGCAGSSRTASPRRASTTPSGTSRAATPTPIPRWTRSSGVSEADVTTKGFDAARSCTRCSRSRRSRPGRAARAAASAAPTAGPPRPRDAASRGDRRSPGA